MLTRTPDYRARVRTADPMDCPFGYHGPLYNVFSEVSEGVSRMLELIQAGGWLMLPIIASSILASTIVVERLWVLRRGRIMPKGLVAEVLKLHRQRALDAERLRQIATRSPLGRILVAGLVNRAHSREVMKEAIHDTGRHVVARLERYLSTLGTIASITPLLGLLGTVIGMIDVFNVIIEAGVGDPGVLAGGIAKALVTTAAGLAVAIPSLIFFRYLDSRVDKLTMAMEEQALMLVEVIQGERENEAGGVQ